LLSALEQAGGYLLPKDEEFLVSDHGS